LRPRLTLEPLSRSSGMSLHANIGAARSAVED
jgi:hypothetical protein